jgi:Fe-S cluster assembly iron-binding protein IscA
MLPQNQTEYKMDISNAAAAQIQLMINNDYTLADHVFRVKIGGKGCDGFEYHTGFSLKHEDDIILHYPDFDLHIDPFTAFYSKEASLDYLLNPSNNEDGFIFINYNEQNYEGKFFKDGVMVPEIKILKEK